MLFDVIDASYLEDYKIKIKFDDGKEGIVDCRKYPKMGGVFSSLKDLKYFRRFYVNKELGTICWPDGQDIAPETLYAQIEK
ncbi:DUF2442 domain-containing protein [Candidatus Saganbacteria bacterium]|nr:DUF2442 domain-containing protein [Candidatus Saganbacteria bacterium]